MVVNSNESNPKDADVIPANPAALPSREPAAVMRCAAVRCHCGWTDASIDLVMRQGEMHFVPVRADVPAELLTRAMLGLKPIESGQIFFRRWQWHQLSLVDQFAARFQIARIVDSPAWVQNLQIQENILWPMLHQGIRHRDAQKRLDSSLESMRSVCKSRSWAALILRLRRSLTMRPAFVSETVLRMSQWLRCMAFRPECVLAIRPLQDIPSENAACFVRCAANMVQSGTAWMWLDANSNALQEGVTKIISHPSPFGSGLESEAT